VRLIGVSALAFGLAGLTSCAPECHNHILSALGQEQSGYLAVVFFRNCGVGSNFNTQVSLSARDYTFPDEGGNVFIASYRHDSPKFTSGSPRVEVQWLSEKALAIDFDGAATVAKAMKQVNGVHVTYRKHLDW
jgi:hypothetical protein